MPMKTDRRGFLRGSAAAMAAGAVMWPIAARAATTLDLSEVLPEENWQTIEIKKYAAAVAEATNGDVQIRVHSGGALGFKGPEHLRVLADGLVPMADLLGAQQAGELPLFKAENLPFLVRDPAELKIFHKYWRPEIDRIVGEQYNQKYLTSMPSPSNCIYINTAPADIEGFRNLRVRGADMTSVEIFDLIGMASIQIPWGELIPALATGRVDGVGTSPTSAVDGKFWEFMKYIYRTNHIWASNFIAINLDAWNAIPPANQEIMLGLAAEYEPQFWDASTNLGNAALQTLVDNGMEIVEMPDGMLEEMQARTRPAIDRYIAEVPEAGPMIEAFLKEVGRA
jgi:TRAP-type C4-dicarboxylate transport system substrate-binding protein